MTRSGFEITEGWEVMYQPSVLLQDSKYVPGVTTPDFERLVPSALRQKMEWVTANKLFVGAGGMSLRILQEAGMPEIKGYGGFPVSGKFLVTRKPEIVENHWSKVYGLAAVGAPPMSVPHLDSRTIDGEHVVVFGPFAGFSPNFLKHGWYSNFAASVTPGNLPIMAAAGLANLDLCVYLAKELAATTKQREDELRRFVPEVDINDWEMITAGQRVQIKKPCKDKIGTLVMGTEVVVNEDSNLGGLLGASPGASVSVSIATEVIEKMFPQEMDKGWREKIQKMIPSYGKRLNDDAALCQAIEDENAKTLRIDWNDQEQAVEESAPALKILVSDEPTTGTAGTSKAAKLQ